MKIERKDYRSKVIQYLVLIIIVFYFIQVIDYHYNITIPAPSNIQYNDAILAKELNEKHIAKQNGQCKEKPCYSLYKKGDIYFILTRI